MTQGYRQDKYKFLFQSMLSPSPPSCLLELPIKSKEVMNV